MTVEREAEPEFKLDSFTQEQWCVKLAEKLEEGLSDEEFWDASPNGMYWTMGADPGKPSLTLNLHEWIGEEISDRKLSFKITITCE